ncbi:MAG: hypothetical protein IPG49_15905 [Proteobacteria bacterium]|nr:hypothetical protein [Pseudomonadota bacterium]
MSRQIEEELLLFNFRSYGRGSSRLDQTHLTPAQAQLVARTAARTPEVMVKVLSSGAGSSKAVQRHIDYIGRKGEVELLTDEGDVLTGKGTAGTIPDEWNLDLQEAGAKTPWVLRRQTPPRLVQAGVLHAGRHQLGTGALGNAEALPGGIRFEASVCHGAAHR